MSDWAEHHALKAIIKAVSRTGITGIQTFHSISENFKSGRAHGKVKPHMIGPENLTSSTLSASYEPPIIATHRSPAANTEMRSLDATLVQYTEVVDKKETGMVS